MKYYKRSYDLKSITKGWTVNKIELYKENSNNKWFMYDLYHKKWCSMGNEKPKEKLQRYEFFQGSLKIVNEKFEEITEQEAFIEAM